MTAPPETNWAKGCSRCGCFPCKCDRGSAPAPEKGKPEKTRGYMVRIDGQRSPALFAGEHVFDLMDALTEVCGVERMGKGQTIEIEVVELTDVELEKMGEFDGF